MGPLFKLLTSSACLLAWVVLAVPSAGAQSGGLPPGVQMAIGRYPAHDDPWDGTDYRTVIQRYKKEGLALPSLSDSVTKPIFERMVASDNIPLRAGLNKQLSVTIRFQKLDSALDPIHKLVVMYADEMQKGKPFAGELARMMVYEVKVSSAILDIHETLIASLDKDARYQSRVDEYERMKNNARQLFTDLVHRMSETKVHSRGDVMTLIGAAMDGLRFYQPILTNQDRQELTQKLSQQIAAATDGEMKKNLTELRDAVQNGRVRT